MTLVCDMPPEAQLAWLSKGLVAQRGVLDTYERYFSGAVPFHLTEARYGEVYRRMQREARPKWAKLVVLAASQRLAVEGFLTQGAMEPDQALWDSFVATGLDQSQHEIHVEAILHGRAYACAWPAEDGTTRIVPESPYEVIHWRSPDRSRLCALKMWSEGQTTRARLFTDDFVYAWATDQKVRWQESGVETADNVARGERPVPHAYDQIEAISTWKADGPAIPNPYAPYLPVVPFVAGARMCDILGRSDLESALDILDRIMALTLDLLLVSKIMGFPVRWATGVEVPTDQDGNPRVDTFTTTIERFLTTESPDAKFGQLPAADLRQIESVISQTVVELAAATETPSSVLATANLSNPVSAEALRAQEIPLVHRVRRHQRSFGPSWVHVARLLALQLDGSVETLWADAEVHSEAALTDALVKQVVSLQLPREAAWEQLPGATPTTVARWRSMRFQQQLEDQLLAPEQPGAAPQQQPQPEQPPSAEQLAQIPSETA